MSKHYEAHDRYEGHDDHYYEAHDRYEGHDDYYYEAHDRYEGHDDYYYGYNGSVDSDGFAHQKADLSHHEVRGDDGYRNAIEGSAGDDLIAGGGKDDVLSGGLGSDVISAGAGNDIVIGGGSRDTGINRIDGGSGDDILVAGGQKTSAFSALFAANPLLNTLVHADAKFADVADIIDGTSSTPGTLFGALGMASTPVENDFIIHSGNGNDLILNFHAATDKIVVDRVLNGVTIDSASLLQHMVVNGSNVTIDLGQGNSVTLVGVDPAGLSAANFVVV